MVQEVDEGPNGGLDKEVDKEADGGRWGRQRRMEADGVDKGADEKADEGR